MTPKAESCLIGSTGFVGGNLLRQFSFDTTFHSANISAIQGRNFDLVVCSGIRAVKWWANQNPKDDRAQVEALLRQLGTIRARQFLMISTIDVYAEPREVDELDAPSARPNHAYGTHRLQAEQFVRDHFENHLIIRLPALFGPGLKKNVIYDLLHDNCLACINPHSAFQYYDLNRLWSDLQRLQSSGLRLVNLATEPVPTRMILDRFFPEKRVGTQPIPTALYDFRSQHAAAWGGSGGYFYDAATVLADLADYIEWHRRQSRLASP